MNNKLSVQDVDRCVKCGCSDGTYFTGLCATDGCGCKCVFPSEAAPEYSLEQLRVFTARVHQPEQNLEDKKSVEMQQTAPSHPTSTASKDIQLDADEPMEDRPYRWTIEPHPYDRSYDTFVTDSDDEAREALLTLWDIAEDHPTFSCAFDAAVASTQQSSEASHNPDRGTSVRSQPESSAESESTLVTVDEVSKEQDNAKS